ncbi:PKD domain-containing protein, partial [bacterium]|nr:PKD domain-containing protein [bacterium]
VTEESGEPPQIIAVSPTEGDSGTEATFTAEVTGDGPFTYYWDFGGGASPNQSSGVSDQPSATVTLSRGGTLPEPVRTYPASLTVTNPFSMTTHDFNLNVSAWWHVTELPQYGAADDYVSMQSVAFAPNGTFWVALELDETPDGPGGRSVRVVSLEGDTWVTHLTMDQPPADEPSLAMDLEGNPALSYARGSIGGALWYARMSGGEWTHEYVAPGGVFKPYSTLVFDSQDRPVIAWTAREGDEPGTKLTMVRKSGAEWVTIFEEGAENDNSGPSIAVGGDDRVRISWRRTVFGPPTEREVRYAVETGAGWNIQTASWENEEVLHGTCLGLTSDGRALIVYGDYDSTQYPGQHRVWLARETEENWDFKHFADYPFDDFGAGVAVAPDGLEIVTFTDYGNEGYEDNEGYWAWFHDGEWETNPLPILDAHGAKVMFHPHGYPTLFTGGWLASYW